MRQLKSVLCLLTVLALTAGAAACGKKSEEQVSLTSQSAAQLSGGETTGDAEETTEEEETEDEEDDDAPVDLKKVKVKGKEKETTAPADEETGTTTATTAKSDSAAKETTTTAAKLDSRASNSDKTSKSGGSSSKSDTADNADSSTNAKSDSDAAKSTTAKPESTTAAVTTAAVTEAVTQAATEALTDPAPETDAPAEENVVTGVIDFSAGTYEGEGIAFDGVTCTISGEGTYILTGDLTGMVEVNSLAKVKLKLGGVHITNPSGPAILCTDAKKLTLTLIEGTSNSLTDGASDLYEGCICSNDTLEIKGAGQLQINGTYAHGISSDDDLIIKNGDITVNAVKSGMIANDDITVSGGMLHVTGATNGIKSKGTLHISGGTLFVYGGSREDKSGIYAGAAFTLTGGYLYSIGCGAAQPDPATSTQYAITVRYSPSLAENGSASIVCDGAEFFNETSAYAFNTVFLSTPELYDGMAFNAYANGAEYGTGFTIAGIATAVEAAAN